MYFIINLSGLLLSLAAVVFLCVSSETYLVSPKYISIYLGFPIILLAISALGCLIKRLRDYSAITLVTMGIFLIGFELFLYSQTDPYNKIQARSANISSHAAQAGRQFDERTTSQVIDDLRKDGLDAWPTFSPTTFLLNGLPDGISIDGTPTLPLTNVANSKSVYCNESGKWLVFQSDNFGFNNTSYYPTEDEPLDVALLGDSFAQGACVQPESSAQAQLNNKSIPTQSFGVGGTGPLIQLALLKEYVAAKTPKHVFWFFYEGNDMHTNMIIEEQNSKLLAYLKPGFSNKLASKQSQIDQALRVFIAEQFDQLKESELDMKTPSFSAKDTLKLIRLRTALGLVSCPKTNQNFSLLNDIFVEADREVSSWGGQLHVVYLPAWDTSCDLFDPSAPAEDSWMHNIVTDLAQAAGINIIDVKTRQFELGGPEAFYWYPGSHFNDAGYSLVAEMIANVTQSDNK
ncbi:hypothetical protein [Thalassospira lohafexi]|uniref:SGNH hydrolase-type esterase domain-containing protein n=1 Tax=Thalassospira lohafexi TaxID=744227 RepID=A0A2N3LB84_9PROT|nr:hypothetical protein [Thalassospira lohafexi]PKR60052.1 hypothetical protein COO92_01380 [Thalassospira lohafexi]